MLYPDRHNHSYHLLSTYSALRVLSDLILEAAYFTDQDLRLGRLSDVSKVMLFINGRAGTQSQVCVNLKFKDSLLPISEMVFSLTEAHAEIP